MEQDSDSDIDSDINYLLLKHYGEKLRSLNLASKYLLIAELFAKAYILFI